MKFIVGTNQHNEIYSDKCGVLVSGKASDEIKHFIDKINKLEAENSKLKSIVMLASNASCYTEYEDACSLARQVLKELENE